MAVAMVPEPMMLMVVMTFLPSWVDGSVGGAGLAQITVVPPSTTSSMPLT